MLIATVMMSLTVFSQIGTVSKDTTKVVISSQVARKITKDLIRLDGCVQENELLNLKITKLEERESLKDSVINILEQKDSNNQEIIHNKDLQIYQYEHLTDDLQTEIETTNNKFIWWRRGTIGGGGIIILLLIFAF
jgi:hypothetical protein